MNRLIAKAIKSNLKSIPILLFIVLLFAAPSKSYAGESSGTSAMIPEAVSQITVNSVNLKAKDFFQSYMSDSADERKNAELYLLGVMDATEGKSWCDYRTFKTITLRERIYEEFRNLSSHQLDERASKVIEHILSHRYPCESKK